MLHGQLRQSFVVDAMLAVSNMFQEIQIRKIELHHILICRRVPLQNRHFTLECKFVNKTDKNLNPKSICVVLEYSQITTSHIYI